MPDGNLLNTPPPEAPQCSARGCRERATVDLRWRNPRLHDASRVKHWLACPQHAGSLAEFLSVRGFLLDQGDITPGPTSPSR